MIKLRQKCIERNVFNCHRVAEAVYTVSPTFLLRIYQNIEKDRGHLEGLPS